MRFSFKSRSGVAGQVRKIVRSQVEKALEEVRGGEDFDRTVHGLRRRCKKLRGLLRLVKPHFEDFAVENRALRDAARLLGGARDARVMIQTLDGLALAGVGREARALLESRADALASSKDQSEELERFAKMFGKLAGRVDRWRLDRRGFELVGDGLEQTYWRFAAGYSKAAETGTAEALHEWRKHVKYHAVHLGLLARAAPNVIGARKALIGSLGDCIGDHHNLAVLDKTLKTQEFAGLSAIESAIATRQRDLAASALGLGRQLAAEKPHALRRRFKAYWSFLPEGS